MTASPDAAYSAPMLSVTAYPQQYIDDARQRIADQVGVFTALAAAVRTEAGGGGAGARGGGGAGAALAALEPEYFANLVIALDNHFVHRSRGQERKDGNAMNEVRVLVSSIQVHGGVMTPERAIRLDPARSILGIAYGDPIRIDAAGFERLAGAFFEALSATYAEPMPR